MKTKEPQFKSIKQAINYVMENRCKLNLENEILISKSAEDSYTYAAFTRSRFKLGEKSMSEDPSISYFYAIYILKSRFKLGEKSIATDPLYCSWYIQEIFKENPPVNFLELCPIDFLEDLLHTVYNKEDVIKVLFKKKILGNK